MALIFPTTENSFGISDDEVSIAFKLSGSDSGLEMAQTINYKKLVSDLPTDEAAALVTLKAYIEAQAKAECEANGFTFS